MRICIMSDTHGSCKQVENVVSQALQGGDVDAWIHCGDVVEDVQYLMELVDNSIFAVAGNNDFRNKNFNDDEFFSLEGFNIMITHGHHYGVRYDTDELAQVAKENSCDIAIYGHTHVVDSHYQEGILILNPGSATLPRDAMRPSFMILNLEEGKKPEVELYRFERKSFFG